MRIDGRSDSNPWLQTRARDVDVSTPNEKEPDFPLACGVSGEDENERDFAAEMQANYAYTHASRTAAAVTGMLEITPDL